MTFILFLAKISRTEKTEWVVWITDLVAIQHLFRLSFRMLWIWPNEIPCILQLWQYITHSAKWIWKL